MRDEKKERKKQARSNMYMNAENISEYINIEYIDLRFNRLVQVHVVEYWPRNLVVRSSISGRLNSVQGGLWCGSFLFTVHMYLYTTH